MTEIVSFLEEHGAVVSVVGMGVLVGLIFWVAQIQAKRRREALQQLCMRIGFHYKGEKLHPSEVGLGILPLFQRGSRQRIRNLCIREFNGKELVYGDYSFLQRTSSSSNNSVRKHSYSVLALKGDFELPALSLSAENFITRAATMVGFQDIDIPHDTEFSRRFVLRGEDEQAIRSFCTAPVLEAAKQLDPDLALEARGGVLTLYSSRLKKVDQLEQWIQKHRPLLEQFCSGA
ncbi:hypothetical protein MRY87_05125 [bacterium]|nr:hypothetical protein [bacterium]